MHHQTQNTDDKESIKEKKLINIIPKESDAFKNIRLDSQTQRYTSNGKH